jgi:hypothetical protein
MLPDMNVGETKNRGHCHLNRTVSIDSVRYINNAFGHPHETRATSKVLRAFLTSRLVAVQ